MPLTVWAFEQFTTFFVFAWSFCWIAHRRIIFKLVSRWSKQPNDTGCHLYTRASSFSLCSSQNFTKIYLYEWFHLKSIFKSLYFEVCSTFKINNCEFVFYLTGLSIWVSPYFNNASVVNFRLHWFSEEDLFCQKKKINKNIAGFICVLQQRKRKHHLTFISGRM